jgi:hypothetical protein
MLLLTCRLVTEKVFATPLICYSLNAISPLICDSLRGVTSKEQRSILVLISPLKALMDDQIVALEQYGLLCHKLTPAVSQEEILKIKCGDVQVFCPFSLVIRVCCCTKSTPGSEKPYSMRCN